MADVSVTGFQIKATPASNDWLLGMLSNSGSEYRTTVIGLSGLIVPVDSFNGRVGVILPVSGDYGTDSITNQSNVEGVNTSNALNTLRSLIEQTGAASVNTISSVFGRQGAVISESGDYNLTGITNGSVVIGDSAAGALNTLDSRLLSTGSALISLNSSTSGALNTSISSLETRLGTTGSLAVLKSQYNAHTILAAQNNDSPQPVTIGNYQSIGKQLGDGIVALSKPSAAEIAAKAEQEIRVYSPADIGAFISGVTTGIAYNLEQTGIATANVMTSVFGRQGVVIQSSGDYSATGIENSSNVIGDSVAGALNTLQTNLQTTGTTLVNLNSSTSGALNTDITGLEARLEATGAATVNAVDSVFGRQGTVVGQSGDYNGTGITNTSNVVGPTIHDAFNTLNTRLQNSGALLGGVEYGSIHFAAGDETTEITAGVGKIQVLAEYGLNVSEVVGYLNGGPTGASFQFDINMSGASIFSTVASIDTGELTTYTAATQPVITGTFIPSGERLIVDFDQVGSTFGGNGPKIIIRGTKE